MSTVQVHSLLVTLLLIIAQSSSSAHEAGSIEDCAGLTICSSLTSALLETYLEPEVAPGISKKLCEQHFTCNEEDLLSLSSLASRALADNATLSRLPRSAESITSIRQELKKNRLFGKYLRKPPNSELRQECRKCEDKRKYCTWYGIGTTVICTAGWLIGGQVTSIGCSVVTLPRSIDCYMNTFFNCYKKDCGLIGL